MKLNPIDKKNYRKITNLLSNESQHAGFVDLFNNS